MSESINGFPCRDCADVALAKRHIDPARPQNGPFDLDSTKRLEEPKATGKNQPLTEGSRGTKVNILT